MAKQLNLVNTNIIECNILVDPDGRDALVRTRFETLDDTGKVVNIKFVEDTFSLLPAQERASINNFLRIRAKRINLEAVGENSSPWIDI